MAFHLAAWAWVGGLKVHRPKSSGTASVAATGPGELASVLTLAQPKQWLVPEGPAATVRSRTRLLEKPHALVVPSEPRSEELSSGAAFEPNQAPGQPDFLAPQAVDRPALARSAPDLAQLEGVPFSGLPIRVRLDIDAAGRVDQVTVIESGPGDEAMVERLRLMWLATPHIPARLGGRDVASSKLIELTIAPGP